MENGEKHVLQVFYRKIVCNGDGENRGFSRMRQLCVTKDLCVAKLL